MMTYEQLLENKIKVAERHGVDIDASLLHPSGKPHQNAIIKWSCELGAALIGADCGMGKTHILIEICRSLQRHYTGKCLIVTELGATDTFINPDPEVGEGARLGVKLDYVTSQAEAMASDCNIVVTNYERVRDDRFNFDAFICVCLDEGNYIKNMASETTDSLHRQLKLVKFKFIATATPCPNEVLELINYAHVLGVCDRGQILTRFFQRNSTKAGELTLHPQHADDFWLFIRSFSIFITEPADLGFPNEGYELPELEVIWHEVKIGRALDAGADRDGQHRMFVESKGSLVDAAKIKRESIEARLQYAIDNIITIYPDGTPVDHWLIWHHLEREREALNAAFKYLRPQYADIFGKQPEDIREKNVVDFTKGELQVLATKPDLNGVGCNFQKHCHLAIALGITDSWDEFYQAIIKRIHRFGQKHKVTIHALYTPEEYSRVQNLKRKWKEHDEMRAIQKKLVQTYGLNHSQSIEERRRSFKVDRKIYQGENYTLINNDCVYEFRQKPDNSTHMFLSSFPFGNHYEYTDKYNDFGHNTSNQEFKNQLMFLLPEMLRTLMPGRIAAVHLKNRIHYGSVTGLGFSIFHRFTHMVCDAMEEAGFQTMGFHYIPTDVVAENNQTYRLTFGEMQKDCTKMGSGIPEEIWIFRKPPTSNANAYADVSVSHNHARCPFCSHGDVVDNFRNEESFLMQCRKCGQFIAEGELVLPWDYEYTLAHWQIDADAFWRSSGNRYLSPEEIAGMTMKQLRKWWNKFNAGTVYDYDEHVKLLQQLDDKNKLSRTFTTLPLRSNTPFVWNDVNRMQGLNLEQSRRKQQNHICPMPFDQVDRCIELYTNPGEEVADPFGGLCTTGIRAVKKGRKAFLTELNDTYAKCGSIYLKEAEQKRAVPTLFDILID
jgi:DNA modification methylase